MTGCCRSLTTDGLSREELQAPAQSRLASEARAVVGWFTGELGSATFVAVGEEMGATARRSALLCVVFRNKPRVTPR